ncbi:ABC transporter substrate-binding protein [Reyranella massiliensis]|uniref:ABC transporter substrate-binding protein n=1 Tax=Reyranella massiliensis TaxID=445220 RepID=UPI000304ACC5|nr:ABC transporter substrate-binding protein [Reyranella massiliensis]
MSNNDYITRRIFSVGAMATGIAAVTPAFAQGTPAQGTPKRGGTLVATWGGGEPQACYVPAGGGSSPTFSSSKLFERLANRNMDGVFEGALAESWKPSADFKSYTIKIRKGVKFHDGKEMTVDDVVYSIGEIWKKYAAASAMTDFVSVEAPDADTVVMTYSKPTPEFFFASTLSANVNYILPKHIYAGSDPITNPANNAPIGTGPWKFKEWVRGSHFEYVKNENYWQKDLPYLDRLIIRYVRDPAGRAAAMEAGDIHIGVFNPIAPPDIKRLTATGKFVATSKGYEEAVWSTTLECNMRNPVFAKREVRQAIFHAINREFIAKTVYYGYARPGTSPIYSPNKEFFTADTYKTGFDPKKAAALLDAAGFPKKADGKRFTVNLLAAGWFSDNGKVGAYVKQALEDVGVGVTLSVPDRPTSIKRIYTDYDFDLAISNQANPSEPIPTTTQYFTTDGIKKGVPFRNANGYSNPDLDALVDKIKVETDPVKRKALVVEFQKITTQEASLLPLTELESITVASTKVQNHSNDPNYLAAGWADIWLAS